MSRLNLAQLALAIALVQAVQAARRDPALVKAAQQFAEDCAQAYRSGGSLAREAQSSWRRHSPQAKGPATGE
ncbi:hypothetical protein OG444_04475 [Streptomyces sp. NBC_01232]|uniref:hypothetical protein n=1 Tax=unclassified Streptomyces TaxID=2593676 RepID=UPI002E148C6D|nr:hypothetical protein OG444_04475 [Streptomyces sp. NBC_01232]